MQLWGFVRTPFVDNGRRSRERICWIIIWMWGGEGIILRWCGHVSYFITRYCFRACRIVQNASAAWSKQSQPEDEVTCNTCQYCFSVLPILKMCFRVSEQFHFIPQAFLLCGIMQYVAMVHSTNYVTHQWNMNFPPPPLIHYSRHLKWSSLPLCEKR